MMAGISDTETITVASPAISVIISIIFFVYALLAIKKVLISTNLSLNHFLEET